MATLPEASVDAVVTDPPYHLTTGKRGGSGQASENLASPAGRSRAGTGFMGKAWDGGDIAHDPATWAAVLRLCKPGAHLLAFGGTRTYHRLACAIEDAGFEIRDQIGWAFGSGFPKSLNLDGEHAGWGTALKPAWEPIVLARKPLDGTVAENVGKHGTGAMNIDGCRVDVSDGEYARNFSGDRGHEGTRDKADRGATDMRMGGGKRPLRVVDPKSSADGNVYGDGIGNGSRAAGTTSLGRWPANLLHDGSPEVLSCFPSTSSGKMKPTHTEAPRAVYGQNASGGYTTMETYGDAGSAARFFYCAKADREDRDDGLAGLVKRKVLIGAAGHKINPMTGMPVVDVPRSNQHPTVKPTDLMRWLCRLVTPVGGTVLDPFAGSGSTGRGALLEGFGFVGIEREAEYVEIARARIAVAAGLFSQESA